MTMALSQAVTERHQKVLVTVDLASAANDVQVAAEAIGVPVAAIDQEFGVVVVNPGIRRHAARVDLSAFERRENTRFAVAAPRADPMIVGYWAFHATFGWPSTRIHNRMSDISHLDAFVPSLRFTARRAECRWSPNCIGLPAHFQTARSAPVLRMRSSALRQVGMGGVRLPVSAWCKRPSARSALTSPRSLLPAYPEPGGCHAETAANGERTATHPSTFKQAESCPRVRPSGFLALGI